VLLFTNNSIAPYSIELRLSLWMLVFLSTFVIPVASLLISFRYGLVASLEMPLRRERIMPMMLISGFYLLTSAYFFVRLEALVVVNALLTGITATLILLTLSTFLIKASAHAAGLGGAAGLLTGLQYHYPEGNLIYPLLVTILLTGVGCSARLALQAHTPAEILWGLMLGTGAGFATMWLML
jgi:hypothetical protein